jgi:hypothetical protein
MEFAPNRRARDTDHGGRRPLVGVPITERDDAWERRRMKIMRSTKELVAA